MRFFSTYRATISRFRRIPIGRLPKRGGSGVGAKLPAGPDHAAEACPPEPAARRGIRDEPATTTFTAVAGLPGPAWP